MEIEETAYVAGLTLSTKDDCQAKCSNTESAKCGRSSKEWSTSNSFSSQARDDLIPDQTIELLDGDHTTTRIRKQRRPYSPVDVNRKSPLRKQNLMKPRNTIENNEVQSKQKPFVCEKCSSPYVVNPARSRSSAKTYTPRKAFDPVTKKILLVCNACRLSFARSRKAKSVKKHPLPSEEAKNKFAEECASFSSTLVERLKDPEAARLYCPVFTLRPCKCLQKYLSEPDEEEQSSRAINLLNLLKKAKHLSAQKNFSQVQNPRPRGLLKQKSHVFEDFVQEMRVYLRTQLKLCERACQRVLMYSNNFLHKQLKSAPDQSARIQRLCGNSRQQLCPIAKLPNENCCQDRCVTMALTHSRLLEDWRTAARRSQRDARRVLAEMLTPSGGAKANCYKFIKMVTGCSHTTISLVNDQMWRTQGNRDPPEHGLRRWWRQQASRRNGEGPDSTISEASADGEEFDLECYNEEGDTQSNKQNIVYDSNAAESAAASPNISDIRIPTARELKELAPAEAGRRLLQQRHKLASVQRQLARQQRQLEALRQQRPPIILGCCSGTDVQCVQQPTVMQQSTPLQSVAHQPQVLHIMEIPSTSSTVPNVTDPGQQQPALSILSSSGEFEPIPNITVNMTSGQPLSTVFFLPEYEAISAVPTDNTMGNNLIVTSGTSETAAIQLPHNQNIQQPASLPASNPGPTCISTSSLHQSPSPAQSQPVPFSSMQFHLPLDVPIQLAIQPTGTDRLPSSQQPLMLPPQQTLTYSVNQPETPASTAAHVSLQSPPAAVVNMVTKDNQIIQSSDQPRVYYLETVNCVSSVPD